MSEKSSVVVLHFRSLRSYFLGILANFTTFRYIFTIPHYLLSSLSVHFGSFGSFWFIWFIWFIPFISLIPPILVDWVLTIFANFGTLGSC